VRQISALWKPQFPQDDGFLEIGFLDLIELRFIKAFTDAGVGLKAIRSCLDHARASVQNDHPFAMRRFRTDGRTIFLESAGVGQSPQRALCGRA
jgi:DNA-binding transcriptional MerR regulator